MDGSPKKHKSFGPGKQALRTQVKSISTLGHLQPVQAVLRGSAMVSVPHGHKPVLFTQVRTPTSVGHGPLGEVPPG